MHYPMIQYLIKRDVVINKGFKRLVFSSLTSCSRFASCVNTFAKLSSWLELPEAAAFLKAGKDFLWPKCENVSNTWSVATWWTCLKKKQFQIWLWNHLIKPSFNPFAMGEHLCAYSDITVWLKSKWFYEFVALSCRSTHWNLKLWHNPNIV